MAQETGPLDVLRGRHVLAVFDIENCVGGARDLGCRLRFDHLKLRLASACRSLRAHAVFSSNPDDNSLRDLLARAGFICHARQIRSVMTQAGMKRTSNSDFRVASAVAYLGRTSPADVIVIATGDGDLGESIAEDVHHFSKKRRDVVTLSLAGSTSLRLNAATNTQIAANIEIGSDVLLPMNAGGPNGSADNCRPFGHTWFKRFRS